MDMLNHHNLLSHTYDKAACEEAVVAIRDRYLSAMVELRRLLKEKESE
jgi:hypothetical protein